MSNPIKGNVTQPSKSLLDPSFPYVPSHKTNLAETFKRAFRELERKPKTTN